jgi:hypothetical protein
MRNNQLQKALNLSKKTGDRVIVFDNSESQNPYVVMDLDEYEKLVIGHSEVRGLTENELLDKINRDIAIWKTDSETKDFNSDFDENYKGINKFCELKDSFESEEDNEEDEEDNEYIKDIYKNDFSSPGLKEMQKDLAKRGRNWSIPTNRKKTVEAEEDSGSEDEDRQYLEEISF